MQWGNLLMAAGLLSMAFTGVTQALETPVTYSEPMWQPSWQCGQPIPITKHLVTTLLKKQALSGFSLKGKPLPLLLAHEPQQFGSLLLVKQATQWIGYPIGEGSTVLGAYSTLAYNRLIIFATWGRQGVNTDYVTLQGKNQLQQFACYPVHLPSELNNPLWGQHYPGLHDFNVDNAGKGTLITANLQHQGNKTIKRWYQYQSTSWGRDWNTAQSIRKPNKATGIFASLQEIRPPKYLIKTLMQAAH